MNAKPTTAEEDADLRSYDYVVNKNYSDKEQQIAHYAFLAGEKSGVEHFIENDLRGLLEMALKKGKLITVEGFNRKLEDQDTSEIGKFAYYHYEIIDQILDIARGKK